MKANHYSAQFITGRLAGTIAGTIALVATQLFVQLGSLAAAHAQNHFKVETELSARSLALEDESTRSHYRFSTSGFIELNESGCLSAHASIVSGQAYGNGWEQLNPSNGHTGNPINDDRGEGTESLKISMDRLYLDLNCYLKNVDFQIGALSAESPGGQLGIRGSGWVDGVRAIVQLGEQDQLQIKLTAGEVDEFLETQALDRDWNNFNYLQILVDTKLSNRMNLVADATHHDTNEYFRLAFEVALDDLVQWIDGFAIEDLIKNGEQTGFLISAHRKIGKWALEVAASDVAHTKSNFESTNLPTRGFYGEGSNLHLFVTRPLRRNWQMRARLRDGDAGERYELRFERGFKFERNRP